VSKLRQRYSLINALGILKDNSLERIALLFFPFEINLIFPLRRGFKKYLCIYKANLLKLIR